MYYGPTLKGIVHPKMKMLPFTHPQVVPNMYLFVLLNTKEDILKKVCNRLFWGTIDFHSRKKCYEGNGAPDCSVSHILQNIFLCVQQSKYIYTGLELLEGE